METELYSNLLNKLDLLIKEINNKQIDRDEVIPLILLALFSKKHILLLGEPGVSKTGIFEIIANCISDARYFDICMKNDTMYEELFGDRYRDSNNRLQYDVEGTVIDSELVLVDEIYRGNSKVLDSLLSATSNYRNIQLKGKGTIKIPLISLFAAANDLPTDLSLRALSDRLTLKFFVERIKDDENWLKFASRQYDRSNKIVNSFKISELDFLYTKSLDVLVSDNILNILLRIKKDVLKYKLTSSDRKFDGAIDILKTSACLNNQKEVRKSDLFLLQHILWEKYEDIALVKNIINENIFGTADKYLEIIEAVKAVIAKVKNFINSDLISLLEFTKSFQSNETNIFENHLNNLFKCIEIIKEQKLNILGILTFYNEIKDLELEIKNNISLPTYENEIFKIDNGSSANDEEKLVDMREVYRIEKETNDFINKYSLWASSYGKIYIYNQEVLKYSDMR